ncbi:glycogen/starch/alpha-glucan phosphorylase [uncultured Desulfuromonas sp.]|uniref:glycogen/starch/alpha-glucan phosphorylase n=1 Tax=uncultured Desulfuromonas sp. TaxID=181013 RepID=UPI002AAC33E8|nr:glycogen/starch/alpha-glucan phosphorylase [uncultured Desulfuromonas sp.]
MVIPDFERETETVVRKALKCLGNDEAGLEASFLHYLYNTFGRHLQSPHYYLFKALSYSVRDRLMARWRDTWLSHYQAGTKKAYYLSMEFLIGRSLLNNLLSLDVEDPVRNVLYRLGQTLEEVENAERDAGLGNGGLGRLAACFMDSCATLQLPVMGYGLRYKYGMFRQRIQNGYQMEDPDPWLRHGEYPWEVQRADYTCVIPFGGCTRMYKEPHSGRLIVHWDHDEEVLAVPYDVPIAGYQNQTVNTLRLWSAASVEDFNLSEFNAGSYYEAVAEKNEAESITMVLYPNDANESGKELRLRQQYFLVSASLQDILKHWKRNHGADFSNFSESNVFQLNDTHPSLAVVELMRLLVDDEHLEWDEAWCIVTQTMAYTNHTLLPEALETWSVSLIRRMLPRHLEIIYEINSRFLTEVSMKWPGDEQRVQRMSLIDPNNRVRMAHLALVGSFSVNGVAELHSRLLREGLFYDFYQLWPEKFNNKTNGVTPRRWLACANPQFRELLFETIGDGWMTDLSQLVRLEDYIDDRGFCRRWWQIRHHNKKRLAELVHQRTGIVINPEVMFDVQVKRIHEYKRQLLNVLHIIHLYARIKFERPSQWTNRCVIIGGKAAPGYAMAKKIIKLIHNVANVINNDPEVGDRLKLVFLPDYNVSAMEVICAGTDLSEQISTAGKEASGTGNMKFMMNGAITIGTLDGANVEIRDAVGEENFFLFGLHAEQVEQQRKTYRPVAVIAGDDDLKLVMQLLKSGHFNRFERGIFDDVIASLTSPHDPWMTLADFRSYVECQKRVAELFNDEEAWIRMSLINCARSGRFSTDRTMREYNDDIWRLTPVEVQTEQLPD